VFRVNVQDGIVINVTDANWTLTFVPIMSTLASASTSQIVTLPHIPELFDSGFLDVLLPANAAPSATSSPQKPETALNPEAPTNPLMEALKVSGQHTLTDNNDAAFNTTGSATLDAFQALAPQSETAKLDELLKDAWREDPALTLRMIWNARSIHDGKGEKELFYQYVVFIS
jgi:hypothetical protein